jgi:hypothetical protein
MASLVRGMMAQKQENDRYSMSSIKKQPNDNEEIGIYESTDWKS